MLGSVGASVVVACVGGGVVGVVLGSVDGAVVVAGSDILFSHA